MEGHTSQIEGDLHRRRAPVRAEQRLHQGRSATHQQRLAERQIGDGGEEKHEVDRQRPGDAGKADLQGGGSYRASEIEEKRR
jgi:hypothetical protein